MIAFLPLAVGLGLAALLWLKHWGLGLALALFMVLLAAAGWGAVLMLSPEAFAKLPLTGSTISRWAWWLGLSGGSLAAVQLARAVVSPFLRKKAR